MRFLAALLILAAPAHAQSLSPVEAAILPRVIDSLCLDLHDSLGCETAILLASETETDRADLLILTDRRSEGGGLPLLIKRNLTFNGALWGMSPSLSANAVGSLEVTSEQTGIGRHAWTRRLTIVWRNEAFVIAGLTYTTYDRITAASARCDINFLTGGYEVSWQRPSEGGERVERGEEIGPSDPARLLVINWDDARPLPAPCQTALDQIE